MISLRKKPDISTDGFEKVQPMSQAKLVNGTFHSDGLCASLTSFFLRMSLSATPDSFLKLDDEKLYKAAVTEEKDMIDHTKDGNNLNQYPFDKLNLPSKTERTAPKKVASLLDKKARAASIIYPTSSGALHSLAFFRTREQCFVQDPNRFILTEQSENGSCPLSVQAIHDIIQRSNPNYVDVTYTPGK